MEIFEKIKGGAAGKVPSVLKNAWKQTVEFLSSDEDEEPMPVVIPESTGLFETFEEKKPLKERACGWMKMVSGKFSPKQKIAVLFIIGIMLGSGLKVVANNHITMGYRDYTTPKTGTYDIISLQKKIAAQGGSAPITGGAPGAGSCSQ